MVMGRVRATSYVRRTISQPLNKNVPPMKNMKNVNGLKDTNLIRNRNLHLQLLCNNKMPAGMYDDELTKVYDLEETLPFYYPRKSDIYGMQNMLNSKLNVLLIFVPIGLLSHFFGFKDIYIFFF